MKRSILHGIAAIACLVIWLVNCTPQPSEPSENTGTPDTYLNFTAKPDSFTTHTGKTDTLLFTLDHSSGVTYTLGSDPSLDSTELRIAVSTDSGTSLVHFDPQHPGTYSVSLLAQFETHSTAASVIITVLPSFTPFAVPHADTLVTSKLDTIIYTLSPEQLAEGIDMGVTVDENLICGTIGVFTEGDDSLLIMVNSIFEGPIRFSVVTANESYSDTISRTITFIEEEIPESSE